MVARKQTKRKPKIAYVKNTLVKALTQIREKSYKQGDSGSQTRFILSGKEMVVLGKLVHSWREIAGIQLASKTCPTRLYQGRLTLAVSDSQWMQTLVFLKHELLKKLQKKFPEMNIKDIQGRVGKLPEELSLLPDYINWPDWTKEEDIKLPEIADTDLLKKINSCQKKLSARVKGLKEQGFMMCQKCSANMTKLPDGICAVCIHNDSKETLIKTRSMVLDQPWINFDEAKRFLPDLRKVEFDLIKTELLDDCLDQIEIYALQISAAFDAKTASEMKKEIVKAVVLDAGCSPAEVDPDNLTDSQILDIRWLEFLKISGAEV